MWSDAIRLFCHNDYIGFKKKMSKKQCIAAGIVLYNPDIERLKKCFDSLKQQV